MEYLNVYLEKNISSERHYLQRHQESSKREEDYGVHLGAVFGAERVQEPKSGKRMISVHGMSWLDREGADLNVPPEDQERVPLAVANPKSLQVQGRADADGSGKSVLPEDFGDPTGHQRQQSRRLLRQLQYQREDGTHESTFRRTPQHVVKLCARCADSSSSTYLGRLTPESYSCRQWLLRLCRRERQTNQRFLHKSAWLEPRSRTTISLIQGRPRTGITRK